MDELCCNVIDITITEINKKVESNFANWLNIVYYRGKVTLRHEWTGSAGVIPRPHRKPVFNNACTVFTERVIYSEGIKQTLLKSNNLRTLLIVF